MTARDTRGPRARVAAATHVYVVERAHTPAPWTWQTSNSWRRLRHGNRSAWTNVLMPTVQWGDGQPDIDVSEADMVLIAAAPELLDALKDAVETLEWIVRASNLPAREPPTEASTIGKARAAIAKATGANP